MHRLVEGGEPEPMIQPFMVAARWLYRTKSPGRGFENLAHGLASTAIYDTEPLEIWVKFKSPIMNVVLLLLDLNESADLNLKICSVWRFLI